jgi:hypothetical protein
MNVEDPTLSLLVWKWELDLSINPPCMLKTMGASHDVQKASLYVPGRMRAVSSASIRLVAMMTYRAGSVRNEQELIND